MTPELWATWRRPSQDEVMDSQRQRGIIERLTPLLAAYHPVLCVGCGDGTELDLLPGCTGVTLNATGLTGRRNVVLADMHCLPFRDRAFAAVFCKDTFEHALSPWIALSELTRVARDYVLLACPDESWEMSAHHPLIPTVRQVAIMAHKLGWAGQHTTLACICGPRPENQWNLNVFKLMRSPCQPVT